MKGLTKDQLKRRDDIAGQLAVVQVELEQALAKFKAKVVEAQAFCQEVKDDIEAYITDRSDRWQEGERGQAYSEWRDAWENVEFGDVEELDEQAAETLLALDSEPNT